MPIFTLFIYKQRVQGYRKTKKKKKFKEANPSFGKLLDQPLYLQPLAYEWVYEKLYGADTSILTKAIEEGSF
jgi:transposase